MCEGIFVLQYNDCSRKVFGDTTLLLGPPTPGKTYVRDRHLKYLREHFFPRHFVVEASGEAVAGDYNSVFSRLVLCKTFRLEEDGKVGALSVITIIS